MKSPRRLQARHDRNYKLVARPTRWGSPYKLEDHGREKTLALYERWLDARLAKEPDFLEPLRGYNLGCFCAPSQSCHADILLRKLYGAGGGKSSSAAARRARPGAKRTSLGARRKTARV